MAIVPFTAVQVQPGEEAGRAGQEVAAAQLCSGHTADTAGRTGRHQTDASSSLGRAGSAAGQLEGKRY